MNLATDQERGGNRDCFWIGLYMKTQHQREASTATYNFAVGGSLIVPMRENLKGEHEAFMTGEPNEIHNEPYIYLFKESLTVTKLANGGGHNKCKIPCESKYYRPA